MAQMGFQAGKGLGREESGRTEPIQVKQLEEGAGLGYDVNPVNSAVVNTPGDIRWFERPPSTTPTTLAPFSTAGRCLTHVTNSRFLSLDTLLRLNEAEDHNTVTKLPDLSEQAKSVHSFYAMSSMGVYDMMDVQMSFVNKLTGVLDRPACIGVDLSVRGMFTPHLSKRCSKSKTLEEIEADELQEEVSQHDLDFVAFDSSSKSDMLKSLLMLIKHLKPGGNCVFYCNKLQDRFTSSIVYLLTRLFRSTSLIKTKTCCPHTPDFFVVSKYHQTSCFNNLDSHLNQCLDSLNTAVESGKDLLEVLPISYLFEPSFYKFVSCFNEKVSQDAVDTIIDLEKMNHQKTFPSGKSNKFIMECIPCLDEAQ